MRRANGKVPVELSRRREEVAFDLAVQGLTEVQIAARLAEQGLGAVTRQAVSLILKRVEKRALADLTERVKLQKVRQTHRLEKVYRDAMAAWEASKRPSKSLESTGRRRLCDIHATSGRSGGPFPPVQCYRAGREFFPDI
jgi:hypothetical protein